MNLRKIEYVPNDDFDAAGEFELADADFNLYVEEEEVAVETSAEFFLLSVEQLRILTAEGERFLFKRLNYLRFRASALQATLKNSQRPKKIEVEVQRLLDAAEQVRSQIAHANFRLVVSIVRRVANSQDEVDEFIAEANTILLKAIDKFNFSLGFRFSTYVTHAVRRHLYRLIQQKYRERSKSQVVENMERLESRPLQSKIGEQKLAAAIELIIDSFDHVLEPREKQIVVARFGLDGTSKGKSMRIIGDELGLSKERVRQLLQSSMEKLAVIARPLDFSWEDHR